MSKTKTKKMPKSIKLGELNSSFRLFTVIKLATTNDTNGNPRRLWVVLNSTPPEVCQVTMSGNIVMVIDEGYEGDARVKRSLESLKQWHDVLIVWGPTFTITPGEYRATKKLETTWKEPTICNHKPCKKETR